MKKSVFLIPFGIKLAYIVLCFVRPPQISDSIIVLALATLCGYCLYLLNIPVEEKSEDQIELEKLELKYRLQKTKIEMEETEYHANKVKVRRDREAVDGSDKRIMF